MAENVHGGHRRRMLDKLRQHGADIFSDHEVLEMLLYFAVRQGDTNPTAHRLLKQFGSLHAVLEAPVEQLKEVEGVGQHTAELLRVVRAVFDHYYADLARLEQHSDRLTTSERIGAYFLPQLSGEREEVLLAAYLDGAGRVIKCETVGRGGHAQVAVDYYKIASNALLCQAQGVAVAHNHPYGTVTPSREDFTVTDQLQAALGMLQIELVDHCIVARGKYVTINQLRRTKKQVELKKKG